MAHQEVDQIGYYFDETFFPFYWPPYEHCRIKRPYWSWHNHYRFLRYQDDSERFFRACMSAKGWYLIRKEVESDETPKE